MHADTVRLDHGCLAIAVDDKSWKIVTLSVNKPVSIVIRVISDSYADTHVQGRRNALLPEIGIDKNILKRQYTNCDRSLLVVPHGNEIAVGIDNPYDVTFLDAIIHSLDSTGEDPWMEPLERFVFAFLEINILIH